MQPYPDGPPQFGYSASGPDDLDYTGISFGPNYVPIARPLGVTRSRCRTPPQRKRTWKLSCVVLTQVRSTEPTWKARAARSVCIVDALTGNLIGSAYGNGTQQLATRPGTTPISDDTNAAFMSGVASTRTTFSSRFAGADARSGTWQDAPTA